MGSLKENTCLWYYKFMKYVRKESISKLIQNTDLRSEIQALKVALSILIILNFNKDKNLNNTGNYHENLAVYNFMRMRLRKTTIFCLIK